MGISTHVLDTTRGRPAAGVPVTLERHDDGAWVPAGQGFTDADGRLKALHPAEPRVATYRITFGVDAYFKLHGTASFYPRVSIEFRIEAPAEHYHVPLLLNPYGYSTYRGS
jgi:5-hydroxyisourate hydrolase